MYEKELGESSKFDEEDLKKFIGKNIPYIWKMD
jgi:hypothetical protein